MNAKTPLIRDFYANTEQIAERFGVSTSTIKKWINMMDLPVYQIKPNSPYMVFEKNIRESWLPLLEDFLLKKTTKKSCRKKPKNTP